MIQAVLETARMVLRPLTLEDAPLLLELDSDPDVMRFITGGRPSTAEEVAETIAQSIGHRWLAFDPSSPDQNEFIGWFGLGADPQPGVRQLGYRLAKHHWAKGLAAEGARALIAHGFDVLDLQRIWAQTMVVNNASRAVMDRCGLRFVAVFHQDWEDPIDGADHGDVTYEINRQDWQRATTRPADHR